MANPVVHFEILGRDGAKSRAFYGSLFGWQIDANNPMNYGMVPAADGQGIGGGVGEGDPTVMFYVQVPDLQAALDKAVQLGGKVVMQPEDIPGAVALAQFADPDGNVIGLVKG